MRQVLKTKALEMFLNNHYQVKKGDLKVRKEDEDFFIIHSTENTSFHDKEIIKMLLITDVNFWFSTRYDDDDKKKVKRVNLIIHSPY